MELQMLLFDEPTSALDPELVGEVLAVMRDLAELGSTTLVVTHEMRFAEEVADELVMIDAARVIERGEPRTVPHAPSTARALARSFPPSPRADPTFTGGDRR